MPRLAVLLRTAALALPLACASGGAGPNCSSVVSEYASALAAAQACDPAAAGSCGALRPATLADACKCQTGVNPATVPQLDQLIAEYQQLGCTSSPPVCNEACVAPATVCVAGGSGATCSGR